MRQLMRVICCTAHAGGHDGACGSSRQIPTTPTTRPTARPTSSSQPSVFPLTIAGPAASPATMTRWSSPADGLSVRSPRKERRSGSAGMSHSTKAATRLAAAAVPGVAVGLITRTPARPPPPSPTTWSPWCCRLLAEDSVRVEDPQVGAAGPVFNELASRAPQRRRSPHPACARPPDPSGSVRTPDGVKAGRQPHR